MNKRGFTAVAVALIVAIVLIVAGGIWYYQAHQSKNSAHLLSSVNTFTTSNVSNENNSSSSQIMESQFSNSQYSFEYPSSFILSTTTDGDVGLIDKITYARSQLSPAELQKQCKSTAEERGEYLSCMNTSPSISFSLINRLFQDYKTELSNEISSGQDGDSLATDEDIKNWGVCTKNGSNGFLTYWDGEFSGSFTCALPINNKTLEISWTDYTSNILIQNIINSLQPLNAGNT